MSMGIRVSIDSRNLKRRMLRIQQKLDKDGKLTVQDIARKGRDMMIERMPKDTGESAKSIVAIERVNKKGTHIAVITQRGQPHPTKHFSDAGKFKGQWFNLARWMLDDGNYMKVWGHTGLPPGNVARARKVPAELRKQFNVRVQNDIKNAIA